MRLKTLLIGAFTGLGLLSAVSAVRANTIHVFNDGSVGSVSSYYITIDSAGDIDSTKGTMYAEILNYPGLLTATFTPDVGNAPELGTLSGVANTTGGNATVDFTTPSGAVAFSGSAPDTKFGDEIVGVLTVTTSIPGPQTASVSWTSQDYNVAQQALDGGTSSVLAPSAAPLPTSGNLGLGLVLGLGLIGGAQALRRRRMSV